MKQPCVNCPFRVKTFTPLEPDSVMAMIDAISYGPFFMHCHKDMLYKDVECKGSAMFKAGDQSGVVFKSAEALTRAHARTRRTPEFSWRHPDDPEDE